MAVERATALEILKSKSREEGMERGRIETLRAQLQNIQNIYNDQIAQLLAAPLQPLALHEAQYILEKALEDRDGAFFARVKQDVLEILNRRR